MATKPSLLDDLGEEVTGIIAPVSLCMAVTVLLVRLLNPEGSSSSSAVVIATLGYREQEGDTSGRKLGGALLNAVIFVAVIGGMTILLFLLFKYKCYKFIYAYMGFAVFNIFFFLTGVLFIQVMKVIKLHIDAFSLAYGLFNFSVVGTLGLLIVPIPLLMKQLYLIWVGIIVAYVFTWIPEWTSWVLLVMMAIYDILAVLIPGGPLKALVDLAIERKQDLPALIYEARPAGGRPYVRGWGNREPAQQGAEAPRPVAEGAVSVATAAPVSMAIQRPGSRGSRPGSAAAVGGGSDVQRDGSGVGGLSGGWVTGPSRMSLPSPDAAAASRGVGEAEGANAGSAGDAVRSFRSQRGLDQVQLQQQYQLQQLQGMGTGTTGSSGPRPVAEGKETPGEGWEMLNWGTAAEQGESRGEKLRNRISRVLSGSKGELLGVDTSSHTSKEALIDQISSDKLQQQQQQPPQTRPSGSVLLGSGAYPWGSDGGAAGPSRLAAAPPSRGGSYDDALSGGGGLKGVTGSRGGAEGPRGPSPGKLTQEQSPGSLREYSTMGVRPVAPALSEEQLAEAVRRSSRNVEDPTQPPPPQRPSDAEHRGSNGEEGDEAHESDLPDAIKLGLGDFIFYSLLVGRAAMYDFMTVFSSYLAIIAGLGLTLLCLAIYKRALPALPFSIALGVVFYFVTRFTLEPFLVPMTVHLAYY